ncbi:MAG: YiiX family permuted papain-like enzyme [Blastochloris sp.]|nr:YiiX family permuted papain-like enzyme [Blastochloris sp.]
MKPIIILGFLLLLACFLSASEPQAFPITGDLVFQDCQSSQSRAIQIATGSSYSHVGMVIVQGSQTLVCEAVQPVKLTAWTEWVKRGKDHHFVLKRLKDPSPLHSPSAQSRLLAEARRHLGKDYDAQFAWSDDRIYCSELVWKMYHRALGLTLSQPRKLREFRLQHPEVQRILFQRYGNKIPLEEPRHLPLRPFGFLSTPRH